MSVLRFVGRTTREAMSALRTALGPDALVLANRPCAEGVELLAAAPEDLRTWQRARSVAEPQPPASTPAPASRVQSPVAAPSVSPASHDAPMSTVSFQQYVRERLRQRDDSAVAAPPVLQEALPMATSGWLSGDRAMGPDVVPPTLASITSEATSLTMPTSSVLHQETASSALLQEMQALKHLITQQHAELGWFEGVRRSPAQARLLKTLVGAGFSLRLARSIVSRLPSDYSEREAVTWLEDVLARNVRCATAEEGFAAGGVFALVGPTGVGKTTTTAKIAAAHVRAHGSDSVVLITVDTYRMGAHDQLRAFGRLLGVPVHVAHDAAVLQDLLRMRRAGQLVLIDTIGLGHRDERVATLLMSLPKSDIQHVVVASSAAQAECIDEVLRAYEARHAAGVILTKLDETARLGGALDCMVRQRVRLLATCHGQRVPEDWQWPDAAALTRRALKVTASHAYSLDDEDVSLVFGVAAAAQGVGRHA